MERNALIQQASDGIFITDLDGNFIEINEYGCQMLGCTRKEILQKNIQDVIVFEIDSYHYGSKNSNLINRWISVERVEYRAKTGISGNFCKC